MADSILRVILRGDAAQLSSSLQRASARLQQFGSKVKAVSSQMQSIALPLALAGGASVKMAADFDKSMTQIKSLVGVASDEVNQMGVVARQMAKSTGQSSNDAAEALFYITSAGLRGADAMSVLQASLKASAIGLGDTKIVADLATSAMNAYGSDTLSATMATDVLVKAVREGKLEATELAGSMGRVLPVASAMGVSFNEVGAAFAALSRTGTNAAEAATQVRGILVSLLKPAKEAEDTMGELGLSSAMLRNTIKQEGLLAALELLKTAFEGNDDAQAKVFGNVRALSGVLDLLGANVATTRTIFDSLNDSVGTTNLAFAETEKSAAYKMTKAINNAKEAFLSLGQTLMISVAPLVEKMTNFISNLVKGFMALSTETQGWIVGLTALSLALPSIIAIISGVASAIALLVSPIGLVVAGLAMIGYIIVQNWKPIRKLIVDVANYFIDLYNTSELFRYSIHLIAGTFAGTWESIKGYSILLWNTFKTLASNIVDLFSGTNDLMVAALTGDPRRMAMALGKLTPVISKVWEDAEDDAAAGEASAKAYYEQIKLGTSKRKIELLTEDDIQAPFDKIAKLWDKFKAMFAGGGGGAMADVAGGGGLSNQFNDMFKPLYPIVVKQLDRVRMAFENLGLSIDSIAFAIGDSFTAAFEAMLDGGSFIKTLGEMLGKLVKQLLAAAMASLILSAILGGLGVKSFAGGGIGFKDIFTKMSGFGNTQAFANGGIISGPTLGLMGEYPNAASNPEVVAPLDRLKSLIGDNQGGTRLSGEFRVKGQDLVVALERANKQRNNFI